MRLSEARKHPNSDATTLVAPSGPPKPVTPLCRRIPYPARQRTNPGASSFSANNQTQPEPEIQPRHERIAHPGRYNQSDLHSGSEKTASRSETTAAVHLRPHARFDDSCPPSEPDHGPQATSHSGTPDQSSALGSLGSTPMRERIWLGVRHQSPTPIPNRIAAGDPPRDQSQETPPRESSSRPFRCKRLARPT